MFYVYEVCMEGCWFPTDIESIRKGELFRVRDCGELITRPNGDCVFRATCDAFVDERGKWIVNIE